ncbi:hypothetical protein EGW08_008099, partial [Elysia chlorotica]
MSRLNALEKCSFCRIQVSSVKHLEAIYLTTASESPLRIMRSYTRSSTVKFLTALLLGLPLLTTAAPTNNKNSTEWRLIAQAEGDTGETGEVMTLSDDVIIEALFTNLDTLQDELEVCEEALREKVLGIEDFTSEMVDNRFVSDPDNILSMYTGGGGSFNISDSDTSLMKKNNSSTHRISKRSIDSDDGNHTDYDNDENDNNEDDDDDDGVDEDGEDGSVVGTAVNSSLFDGASDQQVRALDFHNDIVLFIEETSETTEGEAPLSSTQSETTPTSTQSE